MGVVRHDAIWRHVVIDAAASALMSTHFSQFESFMDERARRYYSVIADTHLPGYLDGISDHHTVSDFEVVRDMALGHYKGDCCPIRVAPLSDDAAVDYHMLAYHIVMSPITHMAVFSFPAEVLRRGGDHTAFIEGVVVSDPGSGQNADMWADVTVVADYGIPVDMREGIDHYVLSPSLASG